MDQLSFSDSEYQRKRRLTRREKFLAEMDQLIPWTKLEKKLKKHYHKGEPRSTALCVGHHAADPLHAGILQPE